MVTLYVECILPLAIVVSDEGTSLWASLVIDTQTFSLFCGNYDIITIKVACLFSLSAHYYLDFLNTQGKLHYYYSISVENEVVFHHSIRKAFPGVYK